MRAISLAITGNAEGVGELLIEAGNDPKLISRMVIKAQIKNRPPKE